MYDDCHLYGDLHTEEDHKVPHIIRGGGVVHAWDCPPCVKAATERDKWADENNPHRAGTKVAAEWRRNHGNSAAIDPRYEHYWSM